MGKRLVLDSNILISALGWPGPERAILLRCIERKDSLFLSIDILQELLRVTEYPKFDFSPLQRLRFISLLIEIATLVEPKKKLKVVKDDPQDNKFLECALEAKADLIVSGDKHLLKLKEYEGIPIVSSADFLKLV